MNEFHISLITFSLLCLFWFTLWKEYWLDNLRENLFSIRDRLFDLAISDNGLSFKDPVYIKFETLINGAIRFGHNLNILQVFIFKSIYYNKFPDKPIESLVGDRLEVIIANHEKENIRRELTKLKTEYEAKLISYLIASSFPLIVFTALIIIFFIIKKFLKTGFGFFITFEFIKSSIKIYYSPNVKNLEYQYETEMNLIKI